jgi:D-inositol-3-phosphate glycosyltransferase
MKVALLTGGQDPPYARGLLRELLARGISVACVGSDELTDYHPAGSERLEFHNFVGDQGPARVMTKAWRVLRYYGRVLRFAARTDARLFHILWFRKFPWLERTLLNACFKLLGKKLVFTAHNVDDQARDGRRGPRLVDRLSLTFLYRSVDHVFVHTPRMKRELVERFGIAEKKVTVVPFGINDVIPVSTATRVAARQQLGLRPDDKVLLFFGHVAPYKGVEDIIGALAGLVEEDRRVTLLLAGPVKNKSCDPYWRQLEALIEKLRVAAHVRKAIRYIPDEDVGLFFRASDVSVLPYRRVYQSGVLALSYAQGLPVIVADVGSLKDDVIEDETGLVFRPGDVLDLAAKIRRYFASDLFRDLDMRSQKIRAYGAERFSWTTNADRTCDVYASTLAEPAARRRVMSVSRRERTNIP